MTQTNDLATLDLNALAAGQEMGFEVPQEDLAAVMRSGDFWPRVQIMSANNEIVKKGDFPLGHFALIKSSDELRDMGKSFDFISFAMRTKAMRIPSPGAAPQNFYDRSNPEFAKIVTAANAVPMSGNMYGPEFLIWIPSEETFALYFFNNPTLRRTAPDLMNLMIKGENPETKAKIYGPVAATTQIEFIKKPKYSWHGASIMPHRDPLPTPKIGAEKWQVEVAENIKKFKNPPKILIEKVETAGEPARER